MFGCFGSVSAEGGLAEVEGGFKGVVRAGVETPEDMGDCEECGDVDNKLPGLSIASATAFSNCHSRWLSAFIKLPLPLSSEFFSKSLILALLDLVAFVNLKKTNVMKTGMRSGRETYITILSGNGRWRKGGRNGAFVFFFFGPTCFGDEGRVYDSISG